MPTKDDKKPEEEAPVTNVKAGFPGTTLASVKPEDPGAQPGQTVESQRAAQDGPSASSSPGVHVIDDGSQPLPGQPEKDSASNAEETVVRTKSQPVKK